MQAPQHARLGGEGMIVLNKRTSDSGFFIDIGAKSLGKETTRVSVPVRGHQDHIRNGLAFKLHINEATCSLSLSALEKEFSIVTRGGDEIRQDCSQMKDMDPDKEARRLASIRYILRRRKRGRRVGANSGGVVKSVQRKIRGHMTFQPSGGASGWWRFSFIFVAMLIAAFPWFVFMLAGSPTLHLVDTNSPLAILFGVPIIILCVLISGFALAYTVLSTWRFLRAKLVHKNE